MNDEIKWIVTLFYTLKIIQVCHFSCLDESICTLSQVYSICGNHCSADVASPKNFSTPLCMLAKISLLFIMSQNNRIIFPSWQWTNSLFFKPSSIFLPCFQSRNRMHFPIFWHMCCQEILIEKIWWLVSFDPEVIIKWNLIGCNNVE